MASEKMADTNGVEEKVSLILKSKKNSNLIVDLLEELDSSQSTSNCSLIGGLTKVFTDFIRKRAWHHLYRDGVGVTQNMTGQHDSETISVVDIQVHLSDAERTFAIWLHEQFRTFLNILLDNLRSHDVNSQSHREDMAIALQSLGALMDILKEDAIAVMRGSAQKDKIYFPFDIYSKIMDACLDHQVDQQKLIMEGLLPWCEFADIRFHTLDSIVSILNKMLRSTRETMIMPLQLSRNLLCILENVYPSDEIVDKFGKENVLILNDTLLTNGRLETIKKRYNNRTFKRAYSQAWLKLLSYQQSRSVMRRVLNRLHKTVMLHMQDPRLLSDFLVDCYNVGGIISILALHGLFMLINEFNLVYPDFYKKLYSLFQVGIFDAYKDRFFSLVDIFLASTYLPAYLVAAFIKRSARIALVASPVGVNLAVKLIHNLLKRHAGCKILLHRKSTKTYSEDDEESTMKSLEQLYQSDPYDYDESDPSASRALQSSLWELDSLQRHYHYTVLNALEELKLPFTRTEHDISNTCEHSYFDIMSEDLKDYHEGEDIPMTFIKPLTLFDSNVYKDCSILSFEV